MEMDVDSLFRSLDIIVTWKREMIMATAKAQAKEPKRKTVGTVMAEKLRAEANGISDSEREELLKEGLAMIYGGCINAKTKANSR
jgi:hypothetical protein